MLTTHAIDAAIAEYFLDRRSKLGIIGLEDRRRPLIERKPPYYLTRQIADYSRGSCATMKNVFSFASFALAASVMFLVIGCGGSHEPANLGALGRVTGTVYDSPADGSVVPGGTEVTIAIEGTNISTTAGPDGSFVLNNVPPGLHTLVARAPGMANALVVKVEPGAETKTGEIVLGEAGQISGLVSSATTYEPIPDAQVVVTDMVYSLESQMPHPVWIKTTDFQGSYTISGLPAGEYLVTISKDGYETASLFLQVNPLSTTPGDCLLQPVTSSERGALAGTAYMKDDQGNLTPLAGVLVRVTPSYYTILRCAYPTTGYNQNGEKIAPPGGESVVPPPPTDRPDVMPWCEYYAMTGEDGTYKIEGIPAGDYTAVAIRPGLQIEEKPVIIKANEVTTADFVLTLLPPRFGTVEGTVTSSATNQPIAGAQVWAVFGAVEPLAGGSTSDSGSIILPEPDECILYTETDEQGHYRLVVPPTVTSVRAYKVGFKPGEVEVSIVLAGTITADISLDPIGDTQVTLSGRVPEQSADGKIAPVAGATVTASPSASPDLVQAFETTSGPDGRYSFTLAPGFYILSAWKEGYSSGWSDELSVFESRTEDIYLSKVSD